VAGGLFTVLVAPLSLNFMTIAPDVAADLRASAAATGGSAQQMPTLIQRILEIVPVNPIRAAADGAMLPVVVFSVAFALALTRLDSDRQDAVLRPVRALADAMLVLVGWILAAAPVGIFALALGLGARLGVAAAGVLVHYMLTLSAVLAVYTVGLYPVARLLGGVPIRRFAAAAAPAQAVAFSTRSSLAALPALIAGARDRLGASATATGFVLPFAVSVFRVNVPIAWVVGAIFLGKLYGVPVGVPELLEMVLISTLISFSVPGIPSASLFLLAPVLVDMGLPAEGAGILIAVDAIPDMFKTTVNVTAHLTAAVTVDRRA
jgi:Na+/H+-dicarboxylate symporter